MTTYGFTAVVSGLNVEDFEQLDRLFTDQFVIVPADMDGLTTLALEVDALSGEEALKIFQNHLCQVPDVRLERIDEDLVNASEIAARLDVSRETPRLWAQKLNGVGVSFPTHHSLVGSPGKPQRLWRWAEVYTWVHVTGRADLSGLPVPLDGDTVTWLNAQVLRQVNHSQTLVLVLESKQGHRLRTAFSGHFSEPRSSRVTTQVYQARTDASWAMQKVGTMDWMAAVR